MAEIRPIEWSEGSLKLLDQTKLPLQRVVVDVSSWRQAAEAIKTMQVRGAPAIGGGQSAEVTCPALSETNNILISGLIRLHLEAIASFDGGQVFAELQDIETEDDNSESQDQNQPQVDPNQHQVVPNQPPVDPNLPQAPEESEEDNANPQ